MASHLANKSLRLPSLAKDEYIGSLVGLASMTAIPYNDKSPIIYVVTQFSVMLIYHLRLVSVCT
jgi:hypothetical protein